MKKQLLLWSMLIGIFFIGNAQLDADGNIIFNGTFKNVLLNYTTRIDTNYDNAINISEARAVTAL